MLCYPYFKELWDGEVDFCVAIEVGGYGLPLGFEKSLDWRGVHKNQGRQELGTS